MYANIRILGKILRKVWVKELIVVNLPPKIQGIKDMEYGKVQEEVKRIPYGMMNFVAVREDN